MNLLLPTPLVEQVKAMAETERRTMTVLVEEALALLIQSRQQGRP